MFRNSPILRVKGFVKELENEVAYQNEQIEFNDTMIEIMQKSNADAATEAKQAQALADNIVKAFS